MDGEACVSNRWTGRALAGLFAVLALYGCWSTPGLIAHWGVSGAGFALFAAWGAAAGWALAAAVRAPARRELAAFAAAALGARVACLLISRDRISPGDSQQYLTLAANLLAGRGLVMWEPYMRLWARALYPPAYPLLLAGWGAVAGLGASSVLALSTAIDLAAAALLARLGARIGAARAGLAAAALYLIWPSALLSAPLAQKEGLQTLLIVALALGWVEARGGWRGALAIGVPAGLLALTQPGQAGLAALFGLALLPMLGWRRVAAIGAAAAAVAVAVMLPWWARNWLVFGAVVPLTSAGGLSLWIGENPDATGGWMPYPRRLAGLPELAYGRAAGRIALDWMAQNPLAVARLNAAKLLRVCGVGQFGLARLAAMRPPASATLTAASLPLSHGAHVAMLAAGAASQAMRRGGAGALASALLLACVGQLLIGIWFEFGERHREFMTPFVLLAIATAVAAIRRRTAPAALASVPQAA